MAWALRKMRRAVKVVGVGGARATVIAGRALREEGLSALLRATGPRGGGAPSGVSPGTGTIPPAVGASGGRANLV